MKKLILIMLFMTMTIAMTACGNNAKENTENVGVPNPLKEYETLEDATDAVGSDDISGDYSEYPEINTISINNVEVTTKGRDGMISNAIWTDNGFTFLSQ